MGWETMPGELFEDRDRKACLLIEVSGGHHFIGHVILNMLSWMIVSLMTLHPQMPIKSN